jgi:peroxiredoxin
LGGIFFACSAFHRRGRPAPGLTRQQGTRRFTREITMTIKIGDKLPEGTLSEFIEVETEACSLGLDADFSKFGMGTRSQRYSMLVEDGVVKQLNVEQGGKFEVSNAETLLGQA